MFCCQRLLNNLFVGNQVAAMIEFSRKNNSFSSANDLSFLFSPSFHFQHFLSIYSPFFPFLATPFHSKPPLVPPSLLFPCFPLQSLIPIPMQPLMTLSNFATSLQFLHSVSSLFSKSLFLTSESLFSSYRPLLSMLNFLYPL